MEKKLFRSTKDKMLAGVAGGLAEYFDIDPVIVRIGFVAAAFLKGIGIIIYILLWIIVPAKYEYILQNSPEGVDYDAVYEERVKQHFEKKNKRSYLAGIILIVLGLIFLADNLIPRIHFDDFLPLILVAAGIALLLNAAKKQ